MMERAPSFLKGDALGISTIVYKPVLTGLRLITNFRGAKGTTNMGKVTQSIAVFT